MLLAQYYGKNVHVIANNGKEFKGKVTDYSYPEDNDSEVESIAIKDSGNYIEFPKTDINSIEIIE